MLIDDLETLVSRHIRSPYTCPGRLVVPRLESQDFVLCGYQRPDKYRLESLFAQWASPRI